MFDLEGLPPQLDELEKIYLWGMQVFGEELGEFRAATASFGPTADREGWEAFLAEAAVSSPSTATSHSSTGRATSAPRSTSTSTATATATASPRASGKTSSTCFRSPTTRSPSRFRATA
jgi:hypothetical protein